MVEEKENIESQIYDLCEEIVKCNNENVKKLKRIVDEEKIAYITSKIKKIEKYINNSALTFELNETKI